MIGCSLTYTPTLPFFGVMLAEATLCNYVEETFIDYVNSSYALLLAAVKAATKVVGYYEGDNRGCWLLQRLPHRLHATTKRLPQRLRATVKVATEAIVDCAEVLHIDFRLLQRLSHRLQAATKAVTQVAGCYKEDLPYRLQAAERLPHRLQAVVNAAT
ncbi:hypothetical protein Tco_0655084 [Tanacetum coccineum]|uniref:Uncharacterized protein n=1 Tax=Tanacetum coccineum TaxID=301880 RepID=A0ABQ4X529_9ASTR